MYWTLPSYKTLYQLPPSMRRFAVRKDIIAKIIGGKEEKHMKKPKLVFDTKTDLRIYEGKELHFNDYLRQQVGAGWYMVRNMLYAAGYGAMEAYEYREKLLEDFRAICKKGNFVPVVYK